MDQSMNEETLCRTEIFSGKVVHLVKDKVRLPNGQESEREIVKHPGAVGILPITDDGRVILVKQFRKPIEEAIWEIPAGKIEAGETDLTQVALRELEEEIGYRATLTPMMDIVTSPGFADEKIHLFKARHLQKINHPRPGDDDEFIEIGIFSWDDIRHLTIEDAKTIVALQQYALQKLEEGNVR